MRCMDGRVEREAGAAAPTAADDGALLCCRRGRGAARQRHALRPQPSHSRRHGRLQRSHCMLHSQLLTLSEAQSGDADSAAKSSPHLGGASSSKAKEAPGRGTRTGRLYAPDARFPCRARDAVRPACAAPALHLLVLHRPSKYIHRSCKTSDMLSRWEARREASEAWLRTALRGLALRLAAQERGARARTRLCP